MPISDILRLQTGSMTRQQIADFMLEADRAARRARARGDAEALAEAEAELEKLERQYRRAA